MLSGEIQRAYLMEVKFWVSSFRESINMNSWIGESCPLGFISEYSSKCICSKERVRMIESKIQRKLPSVNKRILITFRVTGYLIIFKQSPYPIEAQDPQIQPPPQQSKLSPQTVNINCNHAKLNKL